MGAILVLPPVVFHVCYTRVIFSNKISAKWYIPLISARKYKTAVNSLSLSLLKISTIHKGSDIGIAIQMYNFMTS
jgi:hypothetical protein